MEFTITETRLIDYIIHLESELATAHNCDLADTTHSICLALGLPALGPIVDPLIDSGADIDTIESALAESGHTFADLEQYNLLCDFVCERHRARSDSLSQLLLNQRRGPDSAELIHFPTHRTTQ